MIRLDSDGYCTVVITCDECVYWSQIRVDMAAAHECASRHEAACHTSERRARDAARKWFERNATRR